MSRPVFFARQTLAASPAVPVLACTLAIFILSGMDAVMKSLVIAIGVYNTVMWRSILAVGISGSVWFATARPWPNVQVLRLHILRAAIIGVILIAFFWGLARLPLAEGIGLSFVAPLIALYLAALLLGERIRQRAIWASIAGVIGVAIITAGQVGRSGYSWDDILGTAAILTSAVFYAYNLILTRRQALLATPTEIMFFQNLALSAFLILPAPWIAVLLPSELWLPLVGATALSLGGQFLMSWSYARAEAQYLIPTEYSAFIWAIGLGWLFFNETVGWTTMVGACLIIAACLIAARSSRGVS